MIDTAVEMMFRLWCQGEDFGTAHERHAKRWLDAVLASDPHVVASIEPVADDAPLFLIPGDAEGTEHNDHGADDQKHT